jgi:hypothetical protein
MGRRTDGRGDEKMSLAETTTGRDDRLPGTDRRKSPAAFEVRGIGRIIVISCTRPRRLRTLFQDRPVTRVTSIRFFHISLRWSLLNFRRTPCAAVVKFQSEGGLMTAPISAWKSHAWIARQLEFVPGAPFIQRICANCGRNLVKEIRTGDRYAVHVSVIRFNRLSEETRVR